MQTRRASIRRSSRITSFIPIIRTRRRGSPRDSGIFRSDWRYLHDQILERLRDSNATLISLPTSDRLEFTVDIPINGLNGKRCIVVTAWSVDARHEPWFVTAHVRGKRTR